MKLAVNFKKSSLKSHLISSFFYICFDKKNRLKKLFYITISILFFGLFLAFKSNDWGFFGHRKINRMAVFTLPQEMLPLYKKYITYLEEHSVDPDKRRYATRHEAVRHFIDLDQWGVYPFEYLQRDFAEALAYHSKIYTVGQNKDTSLVSILLDSNKKKVQLIYKNDTIASVKPQAYRAYFSKYILPIYYEDEWNMNLDTFNSFFNTYLKDVSFYIKDTLSEHGVLPYYLPTALNKLTKAFEDKDIEKILRYSAEIGHYIGDAHVPLHTTKNYNGQFTDQVGIHAFWESRLPELFSEDEYDFFVGKAQYIDNPKEFFWNIVLKSHTHLNEVLNLEKELSKTFPSDRQWCYDERLGQSIKIQCKEYAKAYHQAMKGMVEDRMTGAIQSIGSIWYTAWINGGQPDIKMMIQNNQSFVQKEEEIKPDPKIKTREHEN